MYFLYGLSNLSRLLILQEARYQYGEIHLLVLQMHDPTLFLMSTDSSKYLSFLSLHWIIRSPATLVVVSKTYLAMQAEDYQGAHLLRKVDILDYLMMTEGTREVRVWGLL